MRHSVLLCRCFILTRSASFKYNAVCFVQNWNWNICKGFFVLFLIYNLTDLFHQNKHLLNVMEMVLKSRMSARSPLNTTVEQGSTCMLKYTDVPTKWAMFQITVSVKAMVVFFQMLLFFSVFKTCLQNFPHILHKWGALITKSICPFVQNCCLWSILWITYTLTFLINKMNDKGKGLWFTSSWKLPSPLSS